jgi:hypothetical protein
VLSPMKLAVPLVVVVASVAPAYADTVSLRAAIGIGGEVEIDNASDDLDTTFGADLVFLHALHKHFALGGSLGLLSWKGEDAAEDADRNLLVDLALRPEVRFDVGRRAQLFAAGAIGGTFSSLGESDFPGGEIESAVGYMLGFELGARFRLGARAGVEVAIGFARHVAEHEVDTVLGSSDVDGEVSGALLRIGGFFDL